MQSFGLIHCDLWGPYRIPSSCGATYFLTIIDDFSRNVWIYLLLEKSEVRTVLPNFCALVQRQFGKMVKVVRSDNGSEFMCLSRYFNENGIIHQASCVATLQQNGRVERKHRHSLRVKVAVVSDQLTHKVLGRKCTSTRTCYQQNSIKYLERISALRESLR